MNTAKSLGVQELVVGASNKFTAEEQLDQMAFYWININDGVAAPLTIRVLSKTWDFFYDVGGGNRIPRISERKARTVAELRAAGVGVRSVLMLHDNTSHSRDLFDAVLTMLDPDVVFDLVHLANPLQSDGSSPGGSSTMNSTSLVQDVDRAQKIGREITVYTVEGDPGPAVVALALEHDYDLIVLDAPAVVENGGSLPEWEQYIREHACAAVCAPAVVAAGDPCREVVDKISSPPFSPLYRRPFPLIAAPAHELFERHAGQSFFRSVVSFRIPDRFAPQVRCCTVAKGFYSQSISLLTDGRTTIDDVKVALSESGREIVKELSMQENWCFSGPSVVLPLSSRRERVCRD